MPRRLFAVYRAAFAGLPRPIWLLAISSLINRSGTMVLPFATLYLTKEMGWTVPEAGLALSFYGAGAMIGSFSGGWLADRISVSLVLVTSLVLNGIGFLTLEHLQSRSAIYWFLVALGTFSEAFRPANATALSAIAGPANRVRAFTLYRLAINLGMSIGPVLGGFLAEHDYRWLFRVDGATCLAAALMLTIWFHDPVEHGTADASDSAARAGRSPWRDGPFVALLGLGMLLAMVFFQIQSTYPLALNRVYGFSEAAIGLALAVNTVIIVLFEMVLAHALRNAPHLRIVAWGSLLFGVGLALLPLGRSFAYVCLTIVVWTLGEMLSLPFLQGVVAERADAKRRGTYLGLLSFAFSIAYMSGPLVGAWVFERFGPAILWYACGVAGVLLWLGFEGLARRMARG
ncbi:MAG TPA: MFS transporter [Thermoanaerobaculia bacterium]|jgi:predicted MFS family arabinose efflux permease|nr:MFS transporter [Thermoanaerobaculia bacterium]